MPIAPTPRSVLATLSKARVAELARDLGIALAAGATKEAQVDLFLRRRPFELPALLDVLGRDELKVACRAHEVDDAGRSRRDLASRLVQAATGAPSPTLPPPANAGATTRLLPREGDIVAVRHRQYLVSAVSEPASWGEATLVRLVCLDDDAQGRPLDVLWELELGARVLAPESHGLGKIDHLDPPRDFAAYLHALKWNRVTATDARLFQAPFRAGIMLKDYQLTPLMKALSLPRANLFIADDVGIGKTIEAGLVLSELALRQRTDWVLILCPAAVALQWQREMDQRFGLRFEVYNRDLVTRRRQERGFGVNPWSTHNRFIISYQTFRRPEYKDPLLHFFGNKKRPKSLLILDEAHTAAPASATKYAVDSAITHTIRHLAPCFENRLFLSATPHNGHSNSFSALLEILDPQRFLRGTPVRGPEQLTPVMVRRLKSDLIALQRGDFPARRIVAIELSNHEGAWQSRRVSDGEATQTTSLGEGPPVELQLSAMLAEYTRLVAPQRGPGRLVFINLQKRLLSSVEAFARTLAKHAARVTLDAAKAQAPLFDGAAEADNDDDEAGTPAEVMDEAEDDRVAAASKHVVLPKGRARELLDAMTALAEQHRNAADAKVRALVAWIQRHQCSAAALGGAKAKGTWTDRRVIIFTEYGHTKSYLRKILGTAVEGTDAGAHRIGVFDGGLPEQSRAALQEAFNGSPAEHPIRVLIATDAAREGINLQGRCQDLFHFDIPWNPARLDQRNGRIDRTLQPEPEVRCMYFVYPERAEDEVLRTVVRKIDTIQRELGSLGSVVMDNLEAALAQGIDERTMPAITAVDEVDADKRETAKREVEATRATGERLSKDIDEAASILNRSRKVLELDPALLRDAIDVGLRLAGSTKLEGPAPVDEDAGKLNAYRVPPLDDTWQSTLDSLRPPRDKDEALYEWRKRPLLPVVFEPPKKLATPVAHLHLAHPFVQRILARFLAQGTAAHDLTRVTAVANPKDSESHVIAFGRLSIFGRGAARLHDQLIAVAATWYAARKELVPFATEDDREALKQLEALFSRAPELGDVDERARRDIVSSAPGHFAELWPHVEAEADAEAQDAERLLKLRGRAEADMLRALIQGQIEAGRDALSRQLTFDDVLNEKSQREQWEDDRKYLRGRLEELGRERDTEPAEIERSYDIVRRRVEPVGLVYIIAGTR